MNYFKKSIAIFWMIFLFLIINHNFNSLGNDQTLFLANKTSKQTIPQVLGLTKYPSIDKEVTLPILMYHKTPSDFESQIQFLIAKGYQSMTLIEYLNYLQNKTSEEPSLKPLIITFDDGFSDQMAAFQILKKYQQKAVFYIFPGSAFSKDCIGIDRVYDDAHQCGDSYLTWNQVLELDNSGIIEIAGHSYDHVDLTSQTDEELSRQILDSKNYIEKKIAHPISNFAYPYGHYNQKVLSIVKQYYSTAVTTVPGIDQDFNSPFQLKRIRNAYDLK